MSDAEAKNDKRPDKKEPGPTASFDSSVLGPGGQIGPFRIERELGRGAVGVVYLAHDTKLDRSVAIKSLPAEVMANPKARSRFAREARVLASLNHPNIATIYEEIKEAEGVGYLVLEYVPGQTLAERIAKKPLKLEEALSIGLQIAEALEAAHERGIIHRDLKPANVKVTPDGVVKVLDFGLAKAVGGEAADQQSTVTEPGRVIGTPAYMSPEQARGKPTDKRSDIWSFGCVLYECLMGQRPFVGETTSDTIAKILEREPDWEALPGNTPWNIRTLLRRCLHKDSNDRLRDIGDARIEIKHALREPVTVLPTEVASAVQPARWKRIFPWGIALVMAVIAAVAVWNWTSPTRQSLVRFFVTLPPDQRLPGAAQSFAPPVALSPDGERLVYVGLRDNRTQLYMRDIHAFEAVPVPGTEGASSPFFSPDGEWLGFFANGKLQKVSMAGGAPLPICDVPAFQGLGVSWGSNDIIIFSPYIGSGLLRVDAGGGVPKKLTTPDFKEGGYSHSWPQILPDNVHVLFNVGGQGQDAGLAVLSLETGLWRPLIQEIKGVWYVPSGHLIYGQAGGLLARPFDLRRLEPVGPPISILDNIYETPRSGRYSFAVSSNGSLAYLPGRSSERTLVWVNRQGTALPVTEDTGLYEFEFPHLSPDGKQVTLTAPRMEGVGYDIWVYDFERGSRTRLTFQPSNNHSIWTPDGTRVTFASNRSGSWNLYWKSADGIGEPEPLLTREHSQFPMSWSPDGKSLAFVEANPNTGKDVWVMSPEGDTSPLLNSPFNEGAARFSPDGRWLAYVSNESGREEVYVQPYPGPGRRWQISNEGGREPVWSADGQELFYRNGEEMMAVAVETELEFKAGTPSTLFKGPYVYDIWTNYDISPDGQRFLMIKEAEKGQDQIHVVLNWFEELKQLVPTGKD